MPRKGINSMSYTQISLEKKKGITMWTAFIAVQFAILFLGVMVGLWIVTLVRISEIETNSQIALVRTFAIVFTVLTAIATIVTVVSYMLYIKYRNLLDGFVDQSLKNIQKEKADVNKKQNINIKLTAPVATPAAPVNKTVQNGPVKKIVTTTTTTTSKPGTVVRTINSVPAKSKSNESKPLFSGLKSLFSKKEVPASTTATKTATTPVGVKPVVSKTTTTTVAVKPSTAAPAKATPVARPAVAPVRPGVVRRTTVTKTVAAKPAVGPRPVPGAKTTTSSSNPRPVMPLRPGVAPAVRR